jgi:peptide/nickel transport system substrate-binding protein
VTGIDTPDAGTVVVKLAAANSEFLGILTAPYTGIVNSDLATQNGANANADADTTDQSEAWFLANSAGGGPFVLTTYRPDDELRLARNDNYWRDKPAAAEIVIRETKDAVTQAQMLQSGDADVAMQLDAATAQNVTSEDVTIQMVPSFNFVYLAVSPGAQNLPVKFTPRSARRSRSPSITRASSSSPSAARAICRRPRSPTGSRARKTCRCPSATWSAPRPSSPRRVSTASPSTRSSRT